MEERVFSFKITASPKVLETVQQLIDALKDECHQEYEIMSFQHIERGTIWSRCGDSDLFQQPMPTGNPSPLSFFLADHVFEKFYEVNTARHIRTGVMYYSTLQRKITVRENKVILVDVKPEILLTTEEGMDIYTPQGIIIALFKSGKSKEMTVREFLNLTDKTVKAFYGHEAKDRYRLNNTPILTLQDIKHHMLVNNTLYIDKIENLVKTRLHL